MKYIILSVLTLFAVLPLRAQEQSQTVKGTIRDAQADYGLPGASVILAGSDPLLGTTTDPEGNFRLQGVPLGRQTLVVQYIGYKTITLPNVLVTAGKEVVLNISLEESVQNLQEVVVTAEADKDLPINELAKVSARTFSLEEVTRYSGGRNDVARLASNFAGVATADDSRNDIIVRGNSPTGLLWRIEGIPIASPNHFSTLGTTGGPVSALNTNLLRTSDFMTGAFPAEYGNALSAVFDINFRNGNTDEHEFTTQMSAFSGLEAMAEGPLSRKNNSSYIASYRYGIASLAATGTSATPYYQDFSFKLNLGDTKMGRIAIFGMGGLSSIDFFGNEIDETDLFANPNEDAYVTSQIGLAGISHTLRLNQNSYLKSTFGISHSQNSYDQDNLIRDESDIITGKFRATESFTEENRYTFNSQYNRKYSARFSLRAGTLLETYQIKASVLDRDNRADIPDSDNDGVPDYFLPLRDANEYFLLSQLYAQGEYKFSDDLSLTAGLHAQHLGYTDAFALEPRLGMSWQSSPVQRWSLAYGYHSQMPPLPILLLREETSPGVFEATNADLGFTRAHHMVIGYDRRLGQDWRLKAESYLQRLTKVPVESTPSSYSVINEGADFIFDERNSLDNEGTGINYGIELTLEKFFSRGYYTLITTSVFDARYEGSDGISRNTAFDNGYVFNTLLGKEWKVGKSGRNALTFDTKLATSGGRYYTPIDLAATRANAGREVLMEELAYSEKYDAYLRWDVKFGFRLNGKRKKISHQFFIDLQNVLDRENVFTQRYNEVTDQINTVTQNGFFPDVLYRIQF